VGRLLINSTKIEEEGAVGRGGGGGGGGAGQSLRKKGGVGDALFRTDRKKVWSEPLLLVYRGEGEGTI